MRTYARLWLCWWSVLGAVGLLLGARELPVLTVIGVSLSAGTAAAAVAFLRMAAHSGSDTSTVELVRRAVLRSPLGALVSVTVVATSFSVGSLIWPMLALLAGTSPWTVARGLRLVRRGGTGSRTARRAPAAPERVEAADWAPAVRSLSDDELCTAWLTSYAAMQAAPSADRARIVTLRQAYLEDLERRNPRGLRAWLDSGAEASGNPATFLAAEPPR